MLRCSEAAETIERLYLMWVQGQRQVVCNQCPRVASQGRPEALKPVDSEPALAGLQIADLLVGRVGERCEVVQGQPLSLSKGPDSIIHA